MSSYCSPQRYLANNRNLARTAVLTPSSVQAVANQVDPDRTIARKGTAQAGLSGSYTGAAQAVYDVEILDTTVSTKLASVPVFSGAGSGLLTGISATSAAAQEITVELADVGIPLTAAGVDFEGVKLRSRIAGAIGNLINLTISQAGLTFTDTAFSLLEDLKQGGGDDTSGFSGAGFDWDTKVLGADNIIPSSAHRIVFGDDTSTVYLNYKKYADNAWTYHLVPALKRDVAKGTPIRYVTGGRTVVVTDGTTPETYTSIATVYDLLNKLKTLSTLITVDGIVANDRSPTGQASRELLVRTDAHVEHSTGSGSKYATGFTNAFANAGASTELITAECFALTSKDYPLAHVGHEAWQVKGSLSGVLGNIYTGVPFADPGGKFGFTIPVKLPPGFGVRKGRFDVDGVVYAPRDVGVELPPICVVALSLGPDAVDQGITVRYKKRPTGDCVCTKMPVPNLNTACLGNPESGGGSLVGYQSDTITKLIALRAWKKGVVKDNSSLAWAWESALLTNAQGVIGFNPDSLNDTVDMFEQTIAQIDLASGALRTAGMTAWDTAVTALQADVALISGTVGGAVMVTADVTLAAGDAVLVYPQGDIFRAAKWVPNSSAAGVKVGFAVAAITAAATGQVRFFGKVPGLSGLTPGTLYYPSATTPGTWTTTLTASASGVAISATELVIIANNSAAEAFETNGTIPVGGLTTDRYKSTLEWALISAGISPLGKSDADTLQSGDGCWQDYGDAYWWEVVGSDRGAYAPAFTNHPFYSCRKADTDGKYYSTHEFAFQINVKCPNLLKEDDEIHLSIGDSAWGSTYQIGDLDTLPVIAAQPLYLAGGQDGSGILTWYVTGSVSGGFAVYSYNPASPAPYSSGGLAFTYTPGGIPNAKGDKFRFSIEGGHYRWRKDGGSWSSSIAIPASAAALDAGLSITFTTGNAPSFYTGDVYTFTALQPWAVANLQAPSPSRWQWTGSSANVVIDLGSSQSLDMLALALHTIPSGATILLEGGTVSGTYTWSEPVTWRKSLIVQPLTATQTARYLRLSLTSATGGGIGWLWAGSAMETVLSADMQLRDAFKINRGNVGLYQGGLTVGSTLSGDLEWQEGSLGETDYALIKALVYWVKTNDDEPFVVVPQITRTNEVLLARIVTDEIELTDITSYNANAGVERKFHAKLPLAGVWQ